MSGKDKKHGKEEASGFSPCKFKACKHNPSKFGFCGEHFDQYKFGLINKHGEYVPDYEKKIEQYEDFKKKKTA